MFKPPSTPTSLFWMPSCLMPSPFWMLQPACFIAKSPWYPVYPVLSPWSLVKSPCFTSPNQPHHPQPPPPVTATKRCNDRPRTVPAATRDNPRIYSSQRGIHGTAAVFRQTWSNLLLEIEIQRQKNINIMYIYTIYIYTILYIYNIIYIYTILCIYIHTIHMYIYNIGIWSYIHVFPYIELQTPSETVFQAGFKGLSTCSEDIGWTLAILGKVWCPDQTCYCTMVGAVILKGRSW